MHDPKQARVAQRRRERRVRAEREAEKLFEVRLRKAVLGKLPRSPRRASGSMVKGHR